MTGFASATPFGAALRPLVFRAGHRHRKAQAEHAARAGEGANDAGTVADKWALLRALTTARDAYGLSDRAIAVLDALLSCHPGRGLDGTAPQIVHPSNRELSARTGGMAQATLRRHIASLVDAGLILRRDSPNGKRYATRDDFGAKADAFGFDLSPFALAAPEIEAEAQACEAHARALKRLREEASLLSRDCARIIAAGLDHAARLPASQQVADAVFGQAQWEAFAAEFAAHGLRLPRGVDGVALEARRSALADLRARVEEAYLALLDSMDSSGNDAYFERHHQNSNTDPHFDSGSEKELKPKPSDQASTVAAAANVPGDAVPLGRLVTACPDFAEYARDGLRDWADAALVANLVRSMLGVSPDAWKRAVAALGRDRATMVIACILQRGSLIRSAGGYLRTLTDKAETQGFSIEPMLRALEGRGIKPR